MTTEHLKTPWTRDGFNIYDAEGRFLFDTFLGNYEEAYKQSSQAADILITAVNAHDALTEQRDALLEACEGIMRVAEDVFLPGPIYISSNERRQLKAAIAKAKGE